MRMCAPTRRVNVFALSLGRAAVRAMAGLCTGEGARGLVSGDRWAVKGKHEIRGRSFSVPYARKRASVTILGS